MKRLLFICGLVFLASAASAQTPVGQAPVGKRQFFTAAGIPNAGGKIYTCVAGAACPGNPLATYTDATGVSQNPNPIILDSGGFIPGNNDMWLSAASYKIVAQNSAGVTQWQIDGVTPTSFLNVPNTWTALQTFSGGIAVPGTASFTGSMNCTIINVRACVSPGNPQGWSGSDVGAWINAAYAAGNSTGVHVQVAPGVYAYTTPIVFATATKPVFLECAPGPDTNLVGNASTTQLNYTPTTGTGMTVNASGSKVIGCSLSGAGTGNSTIGLLQGGVNGCIYCNFDKMDITGFGVGLQYGNNVYVQRFDNPTIHDNGQNILFPAGLAGVGESISFFGGSISNKGAAFSQSCISVQAGNVELRFTLTSIDQCGVVLNGINNRLELDTPHIENPNGSTALPFVKLDTACSGCAIKTQGGRWLEDFVSARTEFILDAATGVNVGNSITILGGSYEPAQTVAQLVHSAQPNCCAVATIVGATQLGNNVFTNLINPSTAGNIWFNAQILASNYLQNFEQGPQTGIAGMDFLWADSGDHNWSWNANANANVAPVQRFPQVAVLQSAYTNATTGFTNVTDGTRAFAFFVAANRSYRMTCHLYYQAAATGGLNVQFTGPAAPTVVAYGLNAPLSVSTFNNSVATSLSTSLGTAVTTATTNFDAEVSFGLVNGANAGSVALQAKSSAAVNLTIQPGSYCVMQ